MSQKFSINQILEAVHTINPEKKSNKKFAKEEILNAVNEIYYTKKNEDKIKNNLIQIQSNTLPLKKEIIKKSTIKRKEKIFTKPLLLTNIIKYEPVKNKTLFLKKLYNSNLKIITMKITNQVAK